MPCRRLTTLVTIWTGRRWMLMLMLMLVLTTQATSWTGSRWICHRLQDLVDSQGRSLRLHDGCQDGNPILEIGGSLLWTQVSGIHRRRQDWGPVPVHHTQETLHTCQAWCRRAVFSRSTFSIFYVVVSFIYYCSTVILCSRVMQLNSVCLCQCGVLHPSVRQFNILSVCLISLWTQTVCSEARCRNTDLKMPSSSIGLWWFAKVFWGPFRRSPPACVWRGKIQN